MPLKHIIKRYYKKIVIENDVIAKPRGRDLKKGFYEFKKGEIIKMNKGRSESFKN